MVFHSWMIFIDQIAVNSFIDWFIKLVLHCFFWIKEVELARLQFCSLALCVVHLMVRLNSKLSCTTTLLVSVLKKAWWSGYGFIWRPDPRIHALQKQLCQFIQELWMIQYDMTVISTPQRSSLLSNELYGIIMYAIHVNQSQNLVLCILFSCCLVEWPFLAILKLFFIETIL